MNGINLGTANKKNMKKEKQQAQRLDPRLDVPSEANREKHINFLEVEEDENRSTDRDADDDADDNDNERQKEWKEGIQEGETIRRGNSQEE